MQPVPREGINAISYGLSERVYQSPLVRFSIQGYCHQGLYFHLSPSFKLHKYFYFIYFFYLQLVKLIAKSELEKKKV